MYGPRGAGRGVKQGLQAGFNRSWQRSLRQQLLRRIQIQRQEGHPPAPLNRVSPVPFIGHDMIDGREKERAELAFAAIHLGQLVFAQQPQKELLR